MFVKLLRWLKGYVDFEIKGRFPERFINICLKYGVFIFNAGPQDRKFCGSLILSDYRTIRRLARRARVTLRVKERHGMPFVLSKYRNRKGLLAGAIFFLIVIILMQSFVWTVEINGTDTLSEAYIRELLYEYGMYEGAFKAGVNFQSIERKLMERVEDISWMSINTIGTKAEVEIREKIPVPKTSESLIPCNVKAERDGIILSMNVKEGSTNLTEGSAVAQGQILISGVIKNSLDELYFVHADGNVMAQTTHSITLETPKSGVYKKPFDTIKRHNLQLFWFKLPLSFSSVSEVYTSRVVSEKLCLNNTCVELGKRTEYCTLYNDSEFNLSDEKAGELLSAEDYLYRLFTLRNCESISSEVSVANLKDKSIMYIKYTCIEDIAYKENIIVN